MSKIFALIFFINCFSTETEVYDVKKIESIQFTFCFKNFSESNLNFDSKLKEKIRICDFFTFTEIDPKSKLETKIFEIYMEESFFKKKEFNCEKLLAEKDFEKKNSIVCYKENLVSNFYFENYKDFDFLNPVFLLAFDLSNERKILLVNFDSDKFRKTELKEFDKLISFTSQKFSYRKPFYFGKIHLREKNLNENFLNSISFPFVLNNLNQEDSDTKIYTDQLGIKFCSKTLEKEFYSVKCKL